MSIKTIYEAINSRHLVQFHYTGEATAGTNIVEPHQLGYSKQGKLTLSGYYLAGTSESEIGPRWKLYDVEHMSQIVALPRQFIGPRDGYKPGTNKILYKIECEI